MYLKLAAAFTSVALAGTGLAIIASPAEAVTTVSITATNVSVTLNACGLSHVTVTGDWANDANNTIDTNVTGPNGLRVGGKSSVNDKSGSIAFDVKLCGSSNTPGTYTVRTRATGSDQNVQNPTTASATQTFKFTKIDPRARSAITRKVTRVRGKYRWLVIGRLFRAGHPYVGRRVAVEVLSAGDWTFVQGQRTRRKGRFGWKFKPNSFTWRYFYSGNATTKPAASKAFRTPRPGTAREVVEDPRSLIS